MAERDHLRRRRVGARRREQARGHAERAGLERVFQQRNHLLQFGVARRALCHAHDHQAQRIVADQHAGVHGGRREALQIIGETRFAKRQPGRARAQIILEQLHFAGQRRRDRKAAMAHDLRGDALAHLAFGLRIDRQREVRMGLDVDEAGRHREPAGIDDPAGRPGDAADARNAAILDRQVAGDARFAGAVEQECRRGSGCRTRRHCAGCGRTAQCRIRGGSRAPQRKKPRCWGRGFPSDACWAFTQEWVAS